MQATFDLFHSKKKKRKKKKKKAATVMSSEKMRRKNVELDSDPDFERGPGRVKHRKRQQTTSSTGIEPDVGVEPTTLR
jgi:hypothetical protein